VPAPRLLCSPYTCIYLQLTDRHSQKRNGYNNAYREHTSSACRSTFQTSTSISGVELFQIMCAKKLGFSIKVTYCILRGRGTIHHTEIHLRRGADKFLARPGRKQATATKLAIYSTYSPRSSIHFLARCYNFCKPLKKKNRNVVRPTRSPRQQ